MSKTKLLTILVVILVVLNSITIGFLVLGHRHGPRPEGPKQMIVDRLSLSGEQVALYEQLIKEHQEALQEKDKEIRAVKTQLFGLLATDDNTAADSLLHVISGLQEDVERIHLNHFHSLKQLCTEDQLPAFNELTTEMAGFFRAPKGPKRRD